MSLRCGIVGLPNVGKSTLFNALTKSGISAENYPFCTIEPNVGVVPVVDARLQQIQSCIPTDRVLPATVEFVDIAGLVRGASKGEGLGNQFLSHIRSTDALVHIVRCFDDDDVSHVEGRIDPVSDIEIIQTELALADIQTLDKKISRYEKLARSDKQSKIILKMLQELSQHLQDLSPARTFSLKPYLKDCPEIERAYLDLHLMTAKQSLYVCNVDDLMSDEELNNNTYVTAVSNLAKKEGSESLILCGKIEEELSQMDSSDQKEMLDDLNMKEPGLNRLARQCYRLLGLSTYFTAGEKEIRAWTIPDGALAPTAAGVIHSDFQRGFICAEVYILEDLLLTGSKAKLKDAGKIRLEGKSYHVQDGDIMEFRFNV